MYVRTHTHFCVTKLESVSSKFHPVSGVCVFVCLYLVCLVSNYSWLLYSPSHYDTDPLDLQRSTYLVATRHPQDLAGANSFISAKVQHCDDSAEHKYEQVYALDRYRQKRYLPMLPINVFTARPWGWPMRLSGRPKAYGAVTRLVGRHVSGCKYCDVVLRADWKLRLSKARSYCETGDGPWECVWV